MTFFRKHNKVILAVGGSILMVLFLIPQAMTGMQGQPTDRPIGTIGDMELTVGHQQQAASDLAIARRILSLARSRAQQARAAITNPQGEEAQMLNFRLQAINQMQNALPVNRGESSNVALEWLLMVTEARQHGLYASRAEIDGMLTAIGLPMEELLDVMRNQRDMRGISKGSLYESMRRWRMIGKLRDLMFTTRRVSEPEMRQFARDYQLISMNYFGVRTGETIGIRLIKVPAEHVLDQAGEPSEEQLLAQFQANRNAPAGQGEPFGFGYRLPSRVKLEYIEIPFKSIEESLAGLDSTREAAMAWLAKPENAQAIRQRIVAARAAEQAKEEAAKAKAEKEAADDAAEDTGDQDQPAEDQPADDAAADDAAADGDGADKPADDEPEEEKDPLAEIDPEKWDAMTLAQRFGAVQSTILPEQTQRLAREKQQTIFNEINDGLNAPLKKIERDDNGYIPTAQAIPQPSMEEIAVSVNNAHGVLPRYVRHEDRWLGLDELDELPTIGKAVIRINQRNPNAPSSIPLSAYISSTRELLGGQTSAMANALKLQKGVPSVPLANEDGNIYLVRVIDAQPSRAPANLDEVREKVVADVKRLMAYEKLQEVVKQDYLPIATGDGLDRLAESLGETFKVEESAPFGRKVMYDVPGRLPQEEEPWIDGVGQSSAFAADAFEAFAKAAQGAEDITALPAKDRFAVISLDGQLAVFVVELTQYNIIDANQYASARAAIQNIILIRDLVETQRMARDTFTLKALKRRTGFAENSDNAPTPDSDDPESTDGDLPNPTG